MCFATFQFTCVVLGYKNRLHITSWGNRLAQESKLHASLHCNCAESIGELAPALEHCASCPNIVDLRIVEIDRTQEELVRVSPPRLFCSLYCSGAFVATPCEDDV